ncbi:hypothetical protein EVAR_65246_1 [Eumeta japonica]|uniref:Uncharacterized protein n=1 Tax=Eumeta variegata TaxID=151549 RepID=A0A4C1ZV43_EUMVA|nr:hypothetical protein EVAR_65246_1 [Eumeta japonica]
MYLRKQFARCQCFEARSAARSNANSDVTATPPSHRALVHQPDQFDLCERHVTVTSGQNVGQRPRPPVAVASRPPTVTSVGGLTNQSRIRRYKHLLSIVLIERNNVLRVHL